jgi:hypothetical protein
MTGAIYFLLSNRFYDDPFITYRYARNLAQGMGFVYNPGLRVLSTTSPLHVILLAVLSFLWSDLPRLANLIGAFSLACGGLLLWKLAQVWGTPSAGWASLVLYPTFPLLLSTLGSETPLYLALCLASLTLYARQRFVLTALFVALASLVRPDGLVLFFLLAIHYLVWLKKPIPWRALAIFSPLVLAWIFFAWSYFGSPLPVTMMVKQVQGTMSISQRFAAGFLGLLEPYTQRLYFWLEVFLAIMGIYLSIVRWRGWLLIWAWMSLHFIGYSLLGVSRYFWYYAPLVPGFIAAVSLGIGGLHDLLTGPSQSLQQKLKAPIFERIIPVWPVAAVVVLVIFFGQLRDLQALRLVRDARYPLYRAAGEWLQANTPASAQVGTLEVGIIGYYAERPMVDFAGLLQPAVALHLIGRDTYEDAALWAVEKFQPESLVLWSGQFPDLRAGYVAQNCTLAKIIPMQQPLSESSLMIYTCYPAR